MNSEKLDLRIRIRNSRSVKGEKEVKFASGDGGGTFIA